MPDGLTAITRFLKSRITLSMTEEIVNNFGFDNDVYSRNMDFVLENSVFKRQLADFMKTYPNSLNLVTKDWKSILINHPILKTFSEKVVAKEIKTSSVVSNTFNFRTCDQLRIIVIADVFFNRKSGQMKTNMVDLFNCGPVYELVNVIAKTLNQNPFHYMTAFLYNCRAMCNQCSNFNLNPETNAFCTKNVSFYDGSKKSPITSLYIEKKGMKRFLGLVVVNVTSYNSWILGDMTSIKLTGVVEEMLLTIEQCVKPVNLGENNHIFHCQEENTDDRFLMQQQLTGQQCVSNPTSCGPSRGQMYSLPPNVVEYKNMTHFPESYSVNYKKVSFEKYDPQ